MLILTEAEVATLLDLDALADALRQAFRSVSDGSASVPPRVGALSPAGLLGAMPGYVPGLGLAAKLVTYFRDNPARGMPGHQAIVVLADPDDGRLLAMMGGTHITAVRTAVAAAVAAEVLAPRDTHTVTIIGTGVQARAHLDAFARSFPGAQFRLSGRSVERVAALAQEYDAVEVAQSIEAGVAGADVVCLCTDSDEPPIRREWLAATCHVSSVGSGSEVDAETVEAADVFVESRTAATQPFPAGSRELGGRDPQTVTEVGEVLLGTRAGRESAGALTLYKSMGHASQDVAAAAVVYRAALAAGVGARVEM